MTVGMKDDAAKPDYSLLPTSWAIHAAGVPAVTANAVGIAEAVYAATDAKCSARQVHAAVDDVVGRLVDPYRLALVLADVEVELIKVLEFGVRKYSRDNWQVVDNAVLRYCAAARRHFSAWAQCGFGDAVAEDSGLPHWAHLLANLTFLAWFKGAA